MSAGIRNLDDDISGVLAGVMLPDGQTLGASGRIAGLSQSGGRISLSIQISPDEADAFAPLRDQVETGLRALDGVTSAFVVLTAERGAPPNLVTKKPAKADPLASVSHVIAVASGKGGVGKSTTTVNLALALVALGLRVGVLDADIYGPSLPTLLGLHGKPGMGEGRKLRPMQAYGLKAMSMGLLVDAETAMVWRGPMVMSAITQMMADVEWGALDVLLVDMPPGTGDAQLALAQGTRLAGAVIVSTPQDLSLIDVRRGIAMFRKVDVPILGVIENMSQFICPDCGNSHAIFGEGGAKSEAARLGVPFLGAVPLTMALRAASDAGQPIVAREPDGTLGRIYKDIAQTMLDGLDLQKPGSVPRKI
ncbi:MULTISPECIES: Mrp/NBP35 family ATP-binding protein [unclassified Yoonia]|uniref:Mrp/NBP35 family ATP-binding protein n=1 Tax=unclassified Yoonia TaxID=2629118 RepID=UPI002AFFDDAD|nr:MULTISPECIES: Mrp/NBP35 family ATP-binding protein [unclassified Yoonia]